MRSHKSPMFGIIYVQYKLWHTEYRSDFWYWDQARDQLKSEEHWEIQKKVENRAKIRKYIMHVLK